MSEHRIKFVAAYNYWHDLSKILDLPGKNGKPLWETLAQLLQMDNSDIMHIPNLNHPSGSHTIIMFKSYVSQTDGGDLEKVLACLKRMQRLDAQDILIKNIDEILRQSAARPSQQPSPLHSPSSPLREHLPYLYRLSSPSPMSISPSPQEEPMDFSKKKAPERMDFDDCRPKDLSPPGRRMVSMSPEEQQFSMLKHQPQQILLQQTPRSHLQEGKLPGWGGWDYAERARIVTTDSILPNVESLPENLSVRSLPESISLRPERPLDFATGILRAEYPHMEMDSLAYQPLEGQNLTIKSERDVDNSSEQLISQHDIKQGSLLKRLNLEASPEKIAKSRTEPHSMNVSPVRLDNMVRPARPVPNPDNLRLQCPQVPGLRGGGIMDFQVPAHRFMEPEKQQLFHQQQQHQIQQRQLEQLKYQFQLQRELPQNVAMQYMLDQKQLQLQQMQQQPQQQSQQQQLQQQQLQQQQFLQKQKELQQHQMLSQHHQRQQKQPQERQSVIRIGPLCKSLPEDSNVKMNQVSMKHEPEEGRNAVSLPLPTGPKEDIDHKYYSYTWPVPHLPTKKHEKKDKTKVVKVEDEELKTVSASLDKNLTISPYSTQDPTGVLITYAVDDEKHLREVVVLYNCLKRNDFQPYLDLKDRREVAKNLFVWIEKKFKAANYVLICITPKYKKTVDASKEASASNAHVNIKACRFIYTLMQTEYSNNNCHNTRFIPLLFPGATSDDIPMWLQNTICYRWRDHWQDVLFRLLEPRRIMRSIKINEEKFSPVIRSRQT